jgi:hypothetical protein
MRGCGEGWPVEFGFSWLPEDVGLDVFQYKKTADHQTVNCGI